MLNFQGGVRWGAMVLLDPKVPFAGRFIIEREVGRGGVGIVYRAVDQVTGTPVALKVVAVSGIDTGEDARFQREGRILASLIHPHIVRLVDFGHTDDGTPYLAMEWLDGEDLSVRHKRAPLSMLDAVRAMGQIADALSSAHAAGVVHRDVKPSNILLRTDNEGALHATLVDFGVAAAQDARVTRTGAIIGTPAYMAPEQARGDGEIDQRSDIYSLGATLFELIAGRPPHTGPTAIAILARLATTPAPRLREVLIEAPLSLDDLLGDMLATAPADRPSSASEIAIALRSLEVEMIAQTGMRLTPSGTPSFASHTTTSRSGGSRVVTTIVATYVPKGDPRTRLLTTIRSRGGEATELGGDAIVAHFGLKRSAGDEASRAAEVAMKVAQMPAAVGVATGRARLERTRAQGEVVDRAAALSRDAKRGQVIADTATTELIRSGFELQLRADGASIVTSARAQRQDGIAGAPFVGREPELVQIMAAFERAAEDATPVIVSIGGAPGMGKTRLRYEALASIGAHRSAPKVVLARAESFGTSPPFGIAADLLAGTLALYPEGERQSLLGQRSEPSEPTSLELLLAKDPSHDLAHSRGVRDALWIALTDFFLAAPEPLVLAVEDAHGADADSIAWIEHMLARASGKRVFMLVTARPSFWRKDSHRFESRDHVRLELGPLGKRATRAIVRSMLHNRAADPSYEELCEQIAAQAAGSPLFAEELSRLAAQGRDSALAPTIEAALQTHLDALDDRERDTAIKLSVFGALGWDEGLEALGAKNVNDALRDLAAAEVLIEQARSRFAGAREWSFKHALMREVAYAALGEEELKRLHARAGAWLAGRGELDGVVAKHFELSGDFATAANHWERAARRSLAANALSDAAALADRALTFAEDKPTTFTRALLLDEVWSRQDARAAERETAVRALEESVYDEQTSIRAKGARVRYEDARGGNDETTKGLDEVRLLAQVAGIVDEETRCAAALASRLAYGGSLPEAEAVAASLLQISAREGWAGAAIDAWQTLAVVYQARGQVGAALDARRQAVAKASEAGLKTRQAQLQINVGFALTTLGARDEAHETVLAGISLAQTIGSPGVERLGKMILLCWSAAFGTLESDVKLLTEPRQVANAALGGAWVPRDRATLGILYYRGAELLRQHQDAQAMLDARRLLQIATEGYRATRMLDVLPVALGLLAEAELHTGQPLRAREIGEEAEALLASAAASLLNEAPIYLALHDALVELGDLRGARAVIERGLPRLVTRVEGLDGTPYARRFLSELRHNAGLVASADAYGLLPEPLVHLIDD